MWLILLGRQHRQSARKLEAHLKWGAISSAASCAPSVCILQDVFPLATWADSLFSPLRRSAFFRLCITFNYSVVCRIARNKSRVFLCSFGDRAHLCVDMTYFLAKSTPTKLMWSPWWLKTNVDLPRIVVVHSVISFVTHSAPLPLRPSSNFLVKLTFSRAPLPIGS